MGERDRQTGETDKQKLRIWKRQTARRDKPDRRRDSQTGQTEGDSQTERAETLEETATQWGRERERQS